ncbi:MAG: DUF2141 domain-containing protein [Spirochaetes bacterium]|nr:DUF2141 domain-containing protein [Spirochaetota bacterium]
MESRWLPNQRTLLIVGFLLLWKNISYPFQIYAQTSISQTYTVQGLVLFQGQGAIFVALVDQDSFSEPETGLAHQVLPNPVHTPKGYDDRSGRLTLSFVFEEIPSGTYALIAFLDENGNGRLDSGMFGPTEPWGMSFRTSRPRFRAPRFEEVMFKVPEEIRFFLIELRK